MNRMLMVVAVLLAGLCVVVAVRHSDGQNGPGRVLAHDVYFTLNDPSPAAQQQLVDACHEYLSGHEGAVYFAAGTRVRENARDVNDQDFEVGLHVYFASKAAHDAYQENPRHKEFIAKMRDNWKTVRVFDSWVSAGP
jgi:hypothetical protein